MANPLTQDVSNKTTSIISTLALLAFLPLLLLGIYQTATIITRATGTPANITVDTHAILEPLQTDFYHAFAQGGEETTNMLAPVTNEIKPLRPKLIRIDHIYDYYNVVSRGGNGLTFDFSRLDSIVDTIRGLGATPVLSLSYMPTAIAKDGSVINPPNDWNEWALVVQKTVEHFSGKSGKNLPGVYYEVWNEPDLEQFGKWKLTGDKNYLTLYRYAAEGASRAQNVNTFSIGGPATTGLYKTWVMALVSSGMRVDFFSWHSYLPTPKTFNDDQRNITKWLLPYPQYVALPKLITEAGFTGAKDARYGTLYAAAHTAATIRHVISGSPTYLFTFQLKDGPGQVAGDGWGLIGHEADGKKLKPRYHVFSFLDDMAGNRLNLTGEGTWVTGFSSIRGDTIRILLVNFDAKGSRAETVPITFTNLEPGTYSYRERFLLGRDATFTENVTESTLQKQLYMPTNSVAIIELKSPLISQQNLLEETQQTIEANRQDLPPEASPPTPEEIPSITP